VFRPSVSYVQAKLRGSESEALELEEQLRSMQPPSYTHIRSEGQQTESLRDLLQGFFEESGVKTIAGQGAADFDSEQENEGRAIRSKRNSARGRGSSFSIKLREGGPQSIRTTYLDNDDDIEELTTLVLLRNQKKVNASADYSPKKESFSQQFKQFVNVPESTRHLDWTYSEDDENVHAGAQQQQRRQQRHDHQLHRHQGQHEKDSSRLGASSAQRRRKHGAPPTYPLTLDPKHSGFRRDLVISMGPLCFLMATMHYPVVKHHCWIVAKDSEARCTMDLEDDVIEDMNNYKKALVTMNHDRNLRTLFFETAVDLNSETRRPVIEVVGIPDKVFSEAKMYFKKAMNEAGSDWNAVSTTGKKVLETSRGRPLARVLPHGDFPYFHVEFGLEGGYVHVIEDEDAFPLDFGRDVVAGMLGLDAGIAKVTTLPSAFDQKQRAKELRLKFNPHDWTRAYYSQRIDQLDEASSKKKRKGKGGRETASSSSFSSALPAALAQGGMESEWRDAIDPKSGKIYYYHPNTGKTTWKRPKKVHPKIAQPADGFVLAQGSTNATPRSQDTGNKEPRMARVKLMDTAAATCEMIERSQNVGELGRKRCNIKPF